MWYSPPGLHLLIPPLSDHGLLVAHRHHPMILTSTMATPVAPSLSCDFAKITNDVTSTQTRLLRSSPQSIITVRPPVQLVNAPTPSIEWKMPQSHRSRRRTAEVQTLTSSLQNAIVDKHNELRAGVSEPCTASDMVELTWDAGLASAALDWVRSISVQPCSVQVEACGECDQ
jgi:uncharacterized protein YkwD